MIKAPGLAKTTHLFILLCAFVLISACQTQPQRDPAYAAVRPSLPPVEPESNGAIYKPGFELRLFEDIKARRIGDILIVRLAESTTAEKAATSAVSKTNSNSITNPTVFGTAPEFDVPKFLPLSNSTDLNLGASLESDHSHSGDGSAEQSNLLNGSITVSVVEVLPNGNLIVRGEKRVKLNTGIEYIQLSGIIRQVDVLSDNSVLSTQVADATITYAGEGELAESNRKGWLARFFSSPFMPY